MPISGLMLFCEIHFVQNSRLALVFIAGEHLSSVAHYHFFCFPVLLKFRSSKGRYPNTENLDSDAKELQSLRADWLKASLGVDPKLVPEDFWK